MTKEEIKAGLVAALKEIQANCGSGIQEITDSTRPMKDLVGFDSPRAVSAAILTSENLGCEIGPDISLFKHGREARTISEITEDIFNIIEDEAQAKKRGNENERK